MPNYLNYESVTPQYNRMKAGLMQTARGVSDESTRAIGSQMAAHGTEGIPGVQADIAARGNRAMLGSVLPQFAQIDQQATEGDARRREHAEKLQYAQKMAREAKSEAKKQFWAQMAIDIAALGVTVVTANPAAGMATKVGLKAAV